MCGHVWFMVLVVSVVLVVNVVLVVFVMRFMRQLYHNSCIGSYS